MAMDNTVTVIGNATRDPELRFTPSGQAVASFGLAVNRRWQNRQTQEWEEQVSFFDVTCWGQFAENVAESIQKGMRCVVTGRLDQRSWETNDGEKRSKIEISAESIGPDLKWATAAVTRNERQGGFEGGSGGGGGGRGGGQQSSGRSGGSSRAAFDSDEEPF